mgnify:FL=1
MEQKIGHYSFIGGVILALLLGVLSAFDVSGAYTPWLVFLLVLAGLTVGFLNVTGKENKEFLLVATVLIIAAGMGEASGVLAKLGGPDQIIVLGKLATGIFGQLLAFVIPATIVVALKDIWALGQNPE